MQNKGSKGQQRRQRDTAQETALAQLFKNAHDAGDSDAMRSLGRELQQRGWEYGEAVPGWPYIKPPAGFQPAPGVDATASLSAIARRQPSVPTPNRGEQALLGLGAGMFKSAGETLAGIPKAVADLPFAMFEPADWAMNKIAPVLSGLSPEIARGIEAASVQQERARAIIRKPIEQNVVGRTLTRAGESLIGTGDEMEATAESGPSKWIPQVAETGGEIALPMALGPGGIPVVAAQTYLQQRGAGSTPMQASMRTGAAVFGLGPGGRIAQRLGGGYLSRVLGYTVGPTAVNQIEQAIETGQLPDPTQVGHDVFKNAVFALGFGAMHGGKPSRARPEAVSEAPVIAERSESFRPTPGPNWPASVQRSGQGILEGIRRIAGGPAEALGKNEISPSPEPGDTSVGASANYEEVAAKRLSGPERVGGMLESIRRYSQPPGLLEKIYRHVFGRWPSRASLDATDPRLKLSGDPENPNLNGQSNEEAYESRVRGGREAQQSSTPERSPLPTTSARGPLGISGAMSGEASGGEHIMVSGVDSPGHAASKGVDSVTTPGTAGDEGGRGSQSAQPSIGAEVPGGAGTWKDVRGHHIHAKSGLRDHPSYDPEKGFSISQEFMRSRGWRHEKMTAAQQKLFRELSNSGRANSLREHTRVAVEALKAGGATEAEARDLVAQSLQDLRRRGVRIPTRVPWTKKTR